MIDPKADNYTIVSPYNYVFNNPISYLDPDGREVINAHDKELEEKRKRMLEAEAKFSKLAGDNKGLSKKELKSKGLFKGELKEAYNEQVSARGEFDGVHKLQFDAKQDINEYKTNDRAGFKELDQLTDNNGNNINVYVGRKDLGKDMPGRTYWKYDEDWKKITTVQNGYVAVNAFSVYINQGTLNAGDVMAHEKGHILDIVKNPASYWADRDTWSNLDCQAPENRANKYVTPARDEQFAYRNRSSNAFIRPKYTSPIH